MKTGFVTITFRGGTEAGADNRLDNQAERGERGRRRQ